MPTRFLPRALVILSVLGFLLAASTAYAQDRKPVNNKSTIRQTRAKSVKKKERASTRDIAGRKLRTRNASSAERAVYTAQPPRQSVRQGERAGQPIGGRSPRPRSVSADRARSNVYPQSGPFVNRSTRKPEQAYSNRRELSRLSRLQTRQDPPGKKKRVTPRSASQAYVTRGKKNVYWGKYSRGERAVTTDIAGRPLRTKNFRTPANPIMKASGPYAGRKPGGDRAYSGSFRSGYKTASRRGELPWKGDISGQPLRKSKGRDNQVAGEPGSSPRILPGFSARYMQKDISRLRGVKTKKGGGSVTGKYRSNQPLPPKAPGLSAGIMRKDLKKIKGFKPEARGALSMSGKNISNKPIGARAPGKSSYLMQKDMQKLRGIKPVKGAGGSISARMHRQTNQPLGAKPPGNPRVATMMGNYKGTMRREELNFSQQGYNYSGNIKAYRPPKGGGSISARMQRNNNNMPIPVREPIDKRAATFQGNYQGFIRARKKTYSNEGYDFSGYQKTRKPAKGGGSVSGKLWNNKGQPIPGRVPGQIAGKIDRYQGNIPFVKKTYGQEGYDFSGYQKTRKPAKGGGSISARMQRNNNNQPIPGRPPGPTAGKIDRYSGNIPFVKKTYGDEGYDFSGYQKTRKPAKGGGSVSGKLWNNNGQPLPPRTPDGGQDINYAGKTKLPRFKREYVRNPNAVEEALKKRSPYKNTFEVNGLMVAVKQKDAKKNPRAKGELPGVPPSKETVKASEYSRTMKMYWSYQRNPSSSKEALKTIQYTKSFKEATTFAGKTRLTRTYRHNPNSHRDALKVIAPSRAYGRLDDYQGNTRMSKYNRKEHFPDATFAHNRDNNVKGERTIFTNAKLLWTNLFKKQGTQPDAVKDKVRRPRYDKKEKELWKVLYE